jgi:TatD DNase family protein
MFDTHCHINFKAFRKHVDEIIQSSFDAGVTTLLIPGTDVATSQRAIEIASQYEGLYVAAGIHPHHVFELYIKTKDLQLDETQDHISRELKAIEGMLADPRAVAVGEIGLDRHMYIKTKYTEYQVTEEFLALQKAIMIQQLGLARTHRKAVVVHNREAAADLLSLLKDNWDEAFRGRMVFHCCEAEMDLLEFAKQQQIFIGVDGDITYGDDKVSFIRQVPDELLVLETDAPYLLPEPLRQQKLYPNRPSNIPLIAERVAVIRGTTSQKLGQMTEENGKRLFGI